MSTPQSAPPTADHVQRAGILPIVLIYAAFAGLWILLSDKAVSWLFSDPTQILLASMLKGLLFVVVTSLLLYGQMRRQHAGGAYVTTTGKGPGWPFLLLAILVASIVAAAIQQTFERQEAKELARLQAIADLKTRLIADWLRERDSDAEFVRTSAFFAEQYRNWQKGGDPNSGKRLQTRLAQFGASHGFSAVTLLDNGERHLWGSTGVPAELAPQLREAVARALADGRTVRVGPYLGAAGTRRLDFVASLVASSAPVPIVILHADLAEWLDATLQTWPAPSVSGETLLFRRDGADVLFINELRHRKGTALRLRIALSRSELLASQVLRGGAQAGEAVRGRDYRNVPVIGVVRAVPGTDWFLVAKLDKDELYGESITDAVWIGLTGLLALTALGTILLLRRQRERLYVAEATWQSQEERLRALRLLALIAENSEDAIFAKDARGCYLLFNHAAERMTGVSAEAVLERDDTVIFPPPMAEKIRALDAAIMRDDQPRNYEEILPGPAGPITVDVSKVPLRDERGHVIGLFGIARDITERRRTEAELRASERRFHDIVNASADWIWEVDAEARFTYVSDSVTDMLGYTPAEVLGKTPFDFMPPDEAVRLRAEFADIAARQAPFRDLDNINLHKDGSVRHVQSNGMPINGPDGELLGYRGLDRNVTEQKSAELALRNMSERLRALVNTIPDLVWLKDPDGVYLACNPRFEAFFGAQEAAIVGRTDYDFVPGELADMFRANDLAAIAAGGPRENEEEVAFASDGHRELLQTIKTPFYDNAGKLIGVLGIARDITARKRAEDDRARLTDDLNATIQAIPDLLFEIDEHGRYIKVEATAHDLLAVPADQLLGHTVAEILPPEAARTMMAALDGASRNDSDYGRTITLPMASGLRHFELSVARKAMTDGSPQRFIVLSRDITERKDAEHVLQRNNEELQRFNRATVGRELDMIDMKRQINALSQELGREPPYSLAFLDAPGEHG